MSVKLLMLQQKTNFIYLKVLATRGSKTFPYNHHPKPKENKGKKSEPKIKMDKCFPLVPCLSTTNVSGHLGKSDSLKQVIVGYRLSLQASSPIWASEASLARTRERCPLWLGRSLAHSRETRFTRPNRKACSQANTGSNRLKSSSLKILINSFTLYGNMICH